MMTTIIKNKWRTPLIAALLLALPTLAVASGHEGTGLVDPDLVIFGDSLADGGNYFTQTGDYSLKPFDLVPSSPYAIGGFHFSNGTTWVRQLAKQMGDNKSGQPSLRVPGQFTNYAYGRARSRPNAATFPDFDLGTQVGMFLADFGGSAPANAIYVVGTGSNDVRDALFRFSSDPAGAIAIIQAAITATADNIVALWASGARTFLVPNSPNIGLTPAVRAFGPAAELGGLQMSIGYNIGLSGALDTLAGLPGIQIIRMDLFGVLTELVADPEAHGFTNATESCITPDVVEGAVCESPGQYLFWDGVHPTRAGHRHLASEAMELLTN